MNRIEGINSYSRLGSVNGAQTGPAAKAAQSTSSKQSADDKVEISSVARYLSQIAAMPDMRPEKVEAIRQALADGTYDLQGKVSYAADQLLDEHFAE